MNCITVALFQSIKYKIENKIFSQTNADIYIDEFSEVELII